MSAMSERPKKSGTHGSSATHTGPRSAGAPARKAAETMST